MCKIVVIPKITEATRDDAQKFIESVTTKMSAFDKDGFGYAAINDAGNLLGERWLKNDEAFKTRVPLTPEEEKIINEYGGAITKEEKYDFFGDIENKNYKAITLHARMATSGKAFYNTHPFVEGDTTLIHNGVITNIDKLTTKYSTCDSETILHQYIKNNVMNHPKNIQKAIDKLDGYYACAVFSKTKDGVTILDVFKDNRANLCAAFIKELDTVVIGTAEEHIKTACFDSGLTIQTLFEFESGVLMRIDVSTGKVIGTYKFDPYKVKRMTKYEHGKNFEDGVKKWMEKKMPMTYDHVTEHGVGNPIKMLPGLSNDTDWEFFPETKIWAKVKAK